MADKIRRGPPAAGDHLPELELHFKKIIYIAKLSTTNCAIQIFFKPCHFIQKVLFLISKIFGHRKKSMCFHIVSFGKEMVDVYFLKIYSLFVHVAAYLYSIAEPNFIWPIKFDKVKSEEKDILLFLNISLPSAQWLEKLNSDTFMLRKMDRLTFYIEPY